MYTKEEIFKAVSTVNDPEVGFNLVEMGLIYDAICDEKMNVIVTMTLSTKACPLHQMILQWVEEAVLRELEKVEHYKTVYDKDDAKILLQGRDENKGEFYERKIFI